LIEQEENKWEGKKGFTAVLEKSSRKRTDYGFRSDRTNCSLNQKTEIDTRQVNKKETKIPLLGNLGLTGMRSESFYVEKLGYHRCWSVGGCSGLRTGSGEKVTVNYTLTQEKRR